MSVTLDVSSDVVGGVVALLLAAVGYLISGYVYPKLMAQSQINAVLGGAKVEITSRSMKSVRNSLGFWTLSLTALVKVLLLILEFGLLGFSKPVTSEQPAVILGGGPRFSDNYATGGELFVHGIEGLPELFAAATGSCIDLVEGQDYRMLKNYYPAFGVDASQSSTSTITDFECTSSWLGSAEWTTESAGNLTIDSASFVEKVAYTDEVAYTLDVGNYVTENLTISYGFGNSFRGEKQTPVALMNRGSFNDIAVAISYEEGHYVYSMSTNMEVHTVGGLEVLTGPFDLGHLRCSEHSLGGVLAVMVLGGGGGSLESVYETSFVWWQSESSLAGQNDDDITYSFSDLIYNNAEGAEQSWPSLEDSMGNIYTEYTKQTAPVMYPFEVDQTEATLVMGWFLYLSAILVFLVCVLSVPALRTKNADSFWSYDGLSLMVGASGKRAVFGVVDGESPERIGFVRNDEA